jgi:hypothetical protein
MKLIKASVPVDRADEVVGPLAEAGALRATLTHVLTVGVNVDPVASTMSMEFGQKVNRMVKLELTGRTRMRTVWRKSFARWPAPGSREMRSFPSTT